MAVDATLAELTTLRVGGPARQVLVASTQSELVEEVRRADAAGEPLLVVGGGSNLLVADVGFPGTVLQVATRGIVVRETDPSGVLVEVAAGERWDAFVKHAVTAGWSGVEALSGIPGSTGATPIQNVGAYGCEVADTLETIQVLDRRTGEVGHLLPNDAGFGYRTSALKRQPGTWVVLTVSLRLAVDPLSAPIRYAELARRLGVEPGARAPLADAREAVMALRRGKGMVLDPADHDTWSAGSFFTNPVVSAEVAAGLPEAAPRFPAGDGMVKTSAAWLISHAGFERGFGVRPGARATLSTKHSLAVTNRGGATAEDLLELARVVRAGVADRFGIVLENEPVLVGCSL
ncbi:MAG: UDP-N-acetylmuramate dehydrogenase [Candidatus Nanopelagicales bacterium]